MINKGELNWENERHKRNWWKQHKKKVGGGIYKRNQSLPTAKNLDSTKSFWFTKQLTLKLSQSFANIANQIQRKEINKLSKLVLLHQFSGFPPLLKDPGQAASTMISMRSTMPKITSNKQVYKRESKKLELQRDATKHQTKTQQGGGSQHAS